MDENALEVVEGLGKPGLARQRLVDHLPVDDRKPLQQKLTLVLWK
jgi:hypothetical protein